ncbi:AAA family ATPase [Paenibacillus sp. CC-CFT747]|nr:AAA family ATPase [Paenibacillus sp. CC-CFT747]
MIVWINGAFGAGKTQTAFELHRRLPGSFVYDPENVGYFIRRNLPKELAGGDFQHFPMWREMNYHMLAYLNREHKGVLLVPMTVVDSGYFDEMVGRLRREGADVRHFALCASRETLLKRLRSRREGPDSWAAQQIDRCVKGLAHEAFRHHLDTEHHTVRDNVEAIASLAGLELRPDNRGPWRRRADRLLTTLKHIRLK